jgi:hypothetical protein
VSGNDWYCPTCGGRLSYGIYCKSCKVETTFAARLANETDLLAARLAENPAPPYRTYVDD